MLTLKQKIRRNFCLRTHEQDAENQNKPFFKELDSIAGYSFFVKYRKSAIIKEK